MSAIFQFHGHSWWFCTFRAESLGDRYPCPMHRLGVSHCSAQDQHGLLTEARFPNPKAPKGSAKTWASSAPEAATVSLLFFHVDFPLPLVTWTMELIGLTFHCKSNKATKIENRTTQKLYMKILVPWSKFSQYTNKVFWHIIASATRHYLNI